MSRRLVAGIDIGTYQVRVVLAKENENGEHRMPKILGVGSSQSKGLRHGYIINSNDTVKSVRIAVNQAEKASGVRIKKAYLSVGGIGLSGVISQGSVIISRADSEITELDTHSALEVAQENIPSAIMQNRQVIYVIPVQYKIDGKNVLGKPFGMKGSKIEVRALFITCLEPHLNDLLEAVEEAGIDVIDVVASPIAASFATLTKAQKIAGCVLANIGAETVSIVVFDNNIPISLEVFPIGSTDVTNDIALGLKIPLEEAESIKLGSLTATSYPKKKLEEIVSARISDMFDLIEAHLKKIGKSGLLPAGVIITGGGSGVGSIEDLAKAALYLPSKLAPLSLNNEKLQIKDSSWSVAYGLCVLGLISDNEERTGMKKLARSSASNILQWVKQFLP